MKLAYITTLLALMLNYSYGVEYVTLSKNNTTKAVPSNALIEVVGYNSERQANAGILTFTLTNGDQFRATLTDTWRPSTSTYVKLKESIGNKYTGVTNISFAPNTSTLDLDGGVVTFKITTANEINSIGPNTFLVLPENSDGNYDVIIESSDDLTTWAPFVSQTVSSQSSPAFFRAKIIQTPTAP